MRKCKCKCKMRCLESLQRKRAVSTETLFQRLLGIWHPQPLSTPLDASYETVSAFGFTTGSREGMAPRHIPVVSLTRPAVAPSALDRTLRFLRAGVPLEQVSRHVVVFNRRLCPGLGGHVPPSGNGGYASNRDVSIVTEDIFNNFLDNLNWQ